MSISPLTSAQTVNPRQEQNLEFAEESDEDIFTVPNMDGKDEDKTNIVTQGSLQSCNDNNGGEVAPPAKRRRGRNPVDKEYRRLKRLLRNRVSAQQAREKKKVYVNELEIRAKELQENSFKLEEKISVLANENSMLRKILMNTRSKVEDNNEETKQR